MKDIRTTLMSISVTRMMYGWTKWGGATEGISKESVDEWFCQICGEPQIKELPSYMIPVDITQRDFIRVCSSCKAKSVQRHIMLCWDLLRLIRGN